MGSWTCGGVVGGELDVWGVVGGELDVWGSGWWGVERMGEWLDVWRSGWWEVGRVGSGWCGVGLGVRHDNEFYRKVLISLHKLARFCLLFWRGGGGGKDIHAGTLFHFKCCSVLLSYRIIVGV